MDKPNKLEKLKSILELMQNDTITPVKLEQFVTAIIKVLNDSKTKMELTSKEVKDLLNNTLYYLELEHNKLLEQVSKETESIDEKITKKLDKSISEMRLMCEKLMMEKPENGKDADEEFIIESVLSKIPKQEEVILDNGEQIVNKINDLPITPENQIDASHIKNLPKATKNGGLIGGLQYLAGDGISINGQIISAIGGSGAVDSVNGQTGVVVLDADDIDDTSTTNKFTNSTDISRLANTSGTNTGDQDLSGYALKSNVLELDNTTPFTPDADYEPATKKYVDDNSGGASTFLDLTDTPASYTGQTGKAVIVNGTEDGLAFTTLSGGTDEKVKYDASDTTAGYIADKIVAGTGISVAEGTGGNENKLVVTNSAPDQTVSITAGTNITSVTGTYPNFTINAATQTTDISGKLDKNTPITGATKTKITYDTDGLVTAGADATTADIADSTDKRYVTDAQLTVIGNTSNTNTGDETQSTIKTKLGAATASVDGYATAAQITKLDGIEAGAEVNNISDVNATDLTDGGATTLHKHSYNNLDNLPTLLTDSSTNTFTNKTFNANGTGNSITNIEVADLASGVLDTDLSSVSANDDTIPSAKATKAALDLKAPLASPTFTGTVTLADNCRIDLTLPTTDTYVTGPTTDSFNAGYSSAVGDLVFFGSGGKWLEVDSDAVATCQGLMGIALEAKTDGQAMKVALPGSMVRWDTWNWTVGATLYAGETLGALQESIPTGADAIIKVVGFALSADVIYFYPSQDQQSTVA